jgi:ABC-type Fe3+-hydroxamate transport system substrate-binding protein
MHTKLSRRSALLLPLAAAMPGRARAALPPITDAISRTVTLKAPAERIVLGFNYEEFTAIGGIAAWQRVVGFDKKQWSVNRPSLWTRYQKVIPGLATLTDIGAMEDDGFSMETFLSLRPDLFVMIAYDYKAYAPLVKQIEDAGIPILVLDFQAQDLAKHIAGTLALGAAIGADDRARALADLYRDKVADVSRRVAGLPQPHTYFELGSAGPGKIGNTYNGAMWGRLVEFTGGANVAAGKIPGPWAPMAAEAVLAAQPDFIFLTGSAWTLAPGAIRTGYDVDAATARDRLQGYLARPGWADLPAARAGNVFAIDAGLARALWDWTAMQYIAKQLHPAAFADVDPLKSLRDYHATYLPVAFEGTWMIRLREGSA